MKPAILWFNAMMTVRKPCCERLSVYRRQTLPLKSYYGKSPVHYISIAGGGDIADISRRLIAELQSQN